MNLIKCLSVGVSVVFLLLVILTPSMNACSCIPSHPQTHFCESDYVIIMRVLRKSHRLVKDRVAYKIEIKKSYKMTDAAQNTLKYGRITTAKSEAMCGVNLEIGKLYVIAGRGPQFNLCSYIKEYQKMSIIERRGFAGTYRKGCKCEIKFCFGKCVVQNNQSCRWSPFLKCETEFSSCTPSVHRTSEGSITQCHWKRTPPYKACLADP